MFSLIADIGGTHARFGLVTAKERSSRGFTISRETKFRCAEFRHLEDALDAYLETIGRPRLTYGSIAIAAPVWNDQVRMTNLDWTFSVEALRKRFGFQRLEVVNDASAGVLATTCMGPEELDEIKAGNAKAGGSRVNIIPGTGFGIGAAYSFGDKWSPVQGEGGHIGLAALVTEEYEVLKTLAQEHGRATPENTLSGPGMLNLYYSLAKVRDIKPLDICPVEMTQLALQEKDELCHSALRIYCRLLGGLAGDYALVFGAHGGVYLSGKVLQKLGADLLRQGFSKRFVDKGKMSSEVSNIPVHLVKRDHTGLLGAAVWLIETLDSSDEFWRVVA